MSNFITNIPYNNNYVVNFSEEAKRIASITGEEVQIFHIGSSAIPKMSGKGIVDILIVTKSDFQELNKKLIQSGLVPRENAGSESRIFYSDESFESENVKFHYHLVRENTPDHLNPIKFRDYLIAHPETAEQYKNLKGKLAKRSKTSREYLDGKADFINNIITKAK